MKQARTIYNVLHGEQSEGGEIIAVETSKKVAIEKGLSVEAHFDDHKWHGEYPYWVNGCDFILISEHIVEI